MKKPNGMIMGIPQGTERLKDTFTEIISKYIPDIEKEGKIKCRKSREP